MEQFTTKLEAKEISGVAHRYVEALTNGDRDKAMESRKEMDMLRIYMEVNNLKKDMTQ